MSEGSQESKADKPEEDRFAIRAWKYVLVAFIAVLPIWLLVGFLPWSLQYGLWPWQLKPGLPPDSGGSFGDSFGFANSLFSSLAFAAVVAAIFLQIEDLRETKRETRQATKAHQQIARLNRFATMANAIDTWAELTERPRGLSVWHISIEMAEIAVAEYRNRAILKQIVAKLQAMEDEGSIPSPEVQLDKEHLARIREAELLISQARSCRSFIRRLQEDGKAEFDDESLQVRWDSTQMEIVRYYTEEMSVAAANQIRNASSDLLASYQINHPGGYKTLDRIVSTMDGCLAAAVGALGMEASPNNTPLGQDHQM